MEPREPGGAALLPVGPGCSAAETGLHLLRVPAAAEAATQALTVSQSSPARPGTLNLQSLCEVALEESACLKEFKTTKPSHILCLQDNSASTFIHSLGMTPALSLLSRCF